MQKVNRLHLAAAILLIAMLACNLPQNQTATQDINAPLTAAAQTIAAQLTQSAPIASPTSPLIPSAIPSNTAPAPTTAAPTLPPPSTATQECDKAQFIDDVTIPDGTVMNQNQAFTKTWRLKNTGTCSWTGYSLVFDSGEAMGGPASSAIGTTPPGGTVDLSVNLTAPSTNGSYRGYWRIRNSTGVLIPVIGGYNNVSFYVDIKVKVTIPAVSATLSYLPGESGLVLSGGATNTLTVAAGDSLSNQGVEAFLSFDMSGVPAGATIQTATLLLAGGSHTRGDPFATLGCMRAYVQNYGVVDASDFVPPGATGAIARWCSAAELSSAFTSDTFINAIQASVGASRFKIRLQFKDKLTDGDGTIDDVLILSPVTLVVTYTP